MGDKQGTARLPDQEAEDTHLVHSFTNRDFRHRFFEEYTGWGLAVLGLFLPWLVLALDAWVTGRHTSLSLTSEVRNGVFLLPIVLLCADSARRMIFLKGKPKPIPVIVTVTLCTVTALLCLFAAVALGAAKLTAHNEAVLTYATLAALSVSYAVSAFSVSMALFSS